MRGYVVMMDASIAQITHLCIKSPNLNCISQLPHADDNVGCWLDAKLDVSNLSITRYGQKMLNVTAGHSKNDTNETTFTRQGSLRRVLPSGHKENLFGRQNEDLNKFYKAVHQEYVVLAEYQMLQSENLPGIYVIPSRETCLTWFGVIFIRTGIYEDAVFRFNLLLPETFPDGGHPKVVFQSDIYHPVIYRDSNELHLLDGFPMWDKAEHHIWQLLKYVHWIFYNFNSSLAHSVNNEAVSLYKENQERYKQKIRGIVQESQQRLYDPPPTDDKHYLTFERLDADVHDAVKEKMLAMPISENNKVSGYSWVNSGSFKALSRENQLPSDNETVS